MNSHQSNDVQYRAELREINGYMENMADIINPLLGVFGKRQLAPLWRIW